MTDVDQALAQLADIRAQMAAGTRFRGLAPAMVASTGLLAIAAAAVQTTRADAGDAGDFVLFWSAVGLLAGGMIAVEALGRARRVHGGMADVLIGGSLRLFLPFGVAGAVLTLVLLRVAPEAAWLLPGLWQMLVALLGFSAAATNLPRSVAWAGGWYLLCATAVLTLAGQTQAASPWMMGVPFGVGQLLVAALLHRAGGDA